MIKTILAVITAISLAGWYIAADERDKYQDAYECSERAAKAYFREVKYLQEQRRQAALP